MKTCLPRHAQFKAQGMEFCIHCKKKLEKPQISFCTKTFRFVRDGVVITEEDARKAWNDTASHDWSVKAFNVMASIVMLHAE